MWISSNMADGSNGLRSARWYFAPSRVLRRRITRPGGPVQRHRCRERRRGNGGSIDCTAWDAKLAEGEPVSAAMGTRTGWRAAALAKLVGAAERIYGVGSKFLALKPGSRFRQSSNTSHHYRGGERPGAVCQVQLGAAQFSLRCRAWQQAQAWEATPCGWRQL